MLPIRSVLIIAVCALAAPVAAAELCVSCAGPSATYVCDVKKADKIKDFAGDKALSQICTKVLKTSGGHASCSVSSASPCAGTVKKVGWSEVKAAVASGLDDVEVPEKLKAAVPKAQEAVKSLEGSAANGKSSGSGAEATAQPEPVSSNPPAIRPPENKGAAAVVDQDRPSLDDGLKGAGDNLQNAGNNLKDAAKKTWDCVSSMFGNC